MESQDILLHKETRVATITLNRPARQNTLTPAMVLRLEAELAALRDDPDVRVVLLTGTEQSFCAGVDVQGTSYNPLNARAFLQTFHRMLRALESLPQPSIAVINGTAVSGGLELALACTFRLTVPEARLGLPEIRLGLVAAGGTTFRLPRLVGFGKALEMCLLGELMNGQAAGACHLVHWLVPRDELAARSRDLALRLAEAPPVALSLVKEALYAAATPQADTAALAEILAASVNHYTEDKKEGLEAFFAKRTPHFRGR